MVNYFTKASSLQQEIQIQKHVLSSIFQSPQRFLLTIDIIDYDIVQVLQTIESQQLVQRGVASTALDD